MSVPVRHTVRLLTVTLFSLVVGLPPTEAGYPLETLGRGVVAINTGDGIYIGWRLLATDPPDIAFNVYRAIGSGKPERINTEPLTTTTDFFDTRADLRKTSQYTVRPVVKGREFPDSAPARLPAEAPVRPFLAVPLQDDLGYGALLAGVGDLDGDGEYDFVVKRTDNDIDPSQHRTYTNSLKLEGYRSDGQFLWRVDLGVNIRPGIWYSPIIVFDFDGDGKAEVATKAAEVMRDLDGDGKTDYRDGNGRVNDGPEYLAILDGETGKTRAVTQWIPRGQVRDWGDNYGNRVNRNLMAVACLDGKRQSLIILRGTYQKMVAQAWTFSEGSLKMLWEWQRPSGGGGFHNIRVGDIDNDGRDEILNGSIAIDDDGSELWDTGEGHGDRFHLADIDPARPGLEIWYCQEDFKDYDHGVHLRDARTGELIFGDSNISSDVGRALAADIDPAHPGLECWASAGPLFAADGTVLGRKPRECSMAIWWDADLLREMLDRNRVSKWNPATGRSERLLTAEGSGGPRGAPCGYGDILGDWREEFWLIHDNRELRIFTTTIPARHRFPTLMHDPIYRISVACQTMGYMQATQTGFFLGEGMTTPGRKPLPTTK